MLSLLLATTIAAAADPSIEPLIIIRGNAVMNEETYRAIIDLPAEADATPANARLVRTRIVDFLHRAGYELAVVNSHAEEGHILVAIDEGRVDKVIVFGQGTFNTIRVKLDLSLPSNVFNRLLLERQLAALAKKYGFTKSRFDLVPVKKHEHVGPQIEDAGRIQAAPVVSPEAAFELQIRLEGREWQSGLSPDISFNSLEGIGAGVRLRGGGLFLDRDRVQVRSRVAGTLRDSLDETRTHLVLSRAIAEARWDTPPLVGNNFRTFARATGDFLNRHRKDLLLEGFFLLAFSGSLHLEYEVGEGVALSVGSGIENRRIFNIDRAAMYMPIVDETPTRQTRVFGEGRVDLWFNTDEVRRDRHHQLVMSGRLFAPADASRRTFSRLEYTYQKMFPIGWHELWLKTRGAALFGDVLFYDEEPVGSAHLRGPFVDTFHSSRLVSASAEFRVSLVRDLFKMSLYHDLVAFRALHLDPPRRRVFFADAFGVGIHVLLVDAFELDAYYGVGLASGERFGHGLVLGIQQAF